MEWVLFNIGFINYLTVMLNLRRNTLSYNKNIKKSNKQLQKLQKRLKMKKIYKKLSIMQGKQLTKKKQKFSK